MIMQLLNRTIHIGLLLSLLVLLPDMALAMESSECMGCHGDIDVVGEELAIEALTFDHTAHADLGCHTCHSSITEEHPDKGLTPSKADCSECHDDVSAEYSNSIHAENAVCSDCHNPHQVYGPTAVSGHDMNLQCASCHEQVEMQEIHSEWLPQADLHINMLPCVTCHSASSEYVISLYIIKRNSGEIFAISNSLLMTS